MGGGDDGGGVFRLVHDVPGQDGGVAGEQAHEVLQRLDQLDPPARVGDELGALAHLPGAVGAGAHHAVGHLEVEQHRQQHHLLLDRHAQQAVHVLRGPAR